MTFEFLRKIYFIQDLVNYIRNINIFSFRLISQANTVAEHIDANGPHVFRDHITALVQKSLGLGSNSEIDTSPWRRTIRDQWLQAFQPVLFGVSCGKDNVENILFHFFVHVNITDHIPCIDDLLNGNDLADGWRTKALHILADDELLEVTPAGWRLRKRFLSADERAKERKKAQMQRAGRG